MACETLRLNRPRWEVLEADLLDFDPIDHQEVYDVDLLAAGLPRVKAAATVGREDRDVEIRPLEATIMLMHGVQPRALLIENVSALLSAPAYEPIRSYVTSELQHLGHRHRRLVVNPMDYGVPQDRKQRILVASKGDGLDGSPPSVSLRPR